MDVKKVILLLLGCLALVACDKKPEAPFGFKWGQTAHSIKSMNLNGFYQISLDGGDSQILVKQSPIKSPPISEYFLFVSGPKGLILAEGRTPVVDISQSSGRDKLSKDYNAVLGELHGAFPKVNGLDSFAVSSNSLSFEKIESTVIASVSEFKNNDEKATIKIQREKKNPNNAWVSLTYSPVN